jgi:large repetitive protein
MRYILLLLLPLLFVACEDDGVATLPPTPYDVKALRITATEIALSWKDSSTMGGSYRILRAVNTSAYETLIIVPHGTTTYNDESLAPEATYSYQLILTDKDGNNSEYSAVATVNGLQNSQMSAFTIPDKHVGDSPFAIAGPTTLNPEPITYSSSNTQVATVGGSVITIVGAGTTVITASQPMSFSFMPASSTASFTVLE